jgi:hypothetical protein
VIELVVSTCGPNPRTTKKKKMEGRKGAEKERKREKKGGEERGKERIQACVEVAVNFLHI